MGGVPANGFTVQMLLELVRVGLVSATPERIVVGGKASEVVRLRITEEGRRALAEMR